MLSAALAVVPVGAALAQTAPAKPVVAPKAAVTPAATKPADPIAPLPDNAASPDSAVPAPVVVELPPPVWQQAQAQALVAYIANVGRDGLSPLDYDAAGLLAAMRAGDPVAMSAAATERFNKLSSDLALGHVRGSARVDWHVIDKDIDPARQRMILDRALYDNRLAEALDALLPVHPQYGALRTALQVTPKSDTAKLNRIRLNMDRWRWLPRELGDKYIIVNVPSFHATLVENGVTRWKRKAIAGAIKTPTPQLNVMATGVILNPSWEVPPSISKEVAGKSGFVAIKDKNGKFQRWSQPPGPTNALGQLKFVMYNPYNIYLHDTNARSRFNSQVRALSHGCVRTENVVDLATELLGDDGGDWTPEKIAAQIASKKTKQANFVKPVPVYIVYFSAAALTDGTITDYQDLYKRDSKVIAALLDNDGESPVAKAPAKKVASK